MIKLKNRLFPSILLCLFLFISSCASTPEEQPEETPVEPEVVVEQPQETEKPEEFVVTEDLYETTFTEIENLINDLNDIISKKEFDIWKSYLSEVYISNYSDREVLAKMSESPIIQDQGIKLKTLEDYFQYIVVPSRSNIALNDIEFETKDFVTVWSLFKGRRVKLYELEKIDDNWKISIW